MLGEGVEEAVGGAVRGLSPVAESADERRHHHEEVERVVRRGAVDGDGPESLGRQHAPKLLAGLFPGRSVVQESGRVDDAMYGPEAPPCGGEGGGERVRVGHVRPQSVHGAAGSRPGVARFAGAVLLPAGAAQPCHLRRPVLHQVGRQQPAESARATGDHIVRATPQRCAAASRTGRGPRWDETGAVGDADFPVTGGDLVQDLGECGFRGAGIDLDAYRAEARRLVLQCPAEAGEQGGGRIGPVGTGDGDVGARPAVRESGQCVQGLRGTIQRGGQRAAVVFQATAVHHHDVVRATADGGGQLPRMRHLVGAPSAHSGGPPTTSTTAPSAGTAVGAGVGFQTGVYSVTEGSSRDGAAAGAVSVTGSQ